MANLEIYGAPIRISPLIKLSRYTFLGLGIFYGLTRNSYLQKKDKENKIYVEKMAPIWKSIRDEKMEKIKNDQINDLKKNGINIE